jgi:adenine C2-methylase RlmN of 23S rRNA A2503 and tRNA A37
MAADMPGVSLALSLHAPNQELRKRIVPSARAYPLNKLLAAVDGYIAASGQRVFVEYVLLSGVNDGDEQAHELGALLQHRNVTLNVIPWNPVLAAADGPQFAAPGEGRVRAFRAIVRGQYGVHCTVRQEKGQDIAGAGQAWGGGLQRWACIRREGCCRAPSLRCSACSPGVGVPSPG